MIQYPIFYRSFGIRRVSQLMIPPMPNLERLKLPRNSLLHYPGDGILDDGPRSDEFLFRDITRPILLGNVTTIGDNKGTPRRLTIPVDPLIRSYFIQNRRYRKLMDFTNIPKDPMAMVVMNYSFIPRLYRYMRSVYSEYYRWNNQQAAIWKNANAIAQVSDRNQFIMAKLPTRLPSINELKLATNAMNQTTVKKFAEPESLFIFELWKWLGDRRGSSLFNYVDKENLDKMNIIFMESGRFFVMNLGVLNSWRIASKDELIIDENANTKGFSSIELQKRFLRLLIALFEARTSQVQENLGDDAESLDTDLDSYDQDSKEVLSPEEALERKEAIFNGIEPATDIEENFEEDLNLDKELAELDRIAALANTDINPDDVNPLLSLDDDDDTLSQPDYEKELESELISSMAGESRVLEEALMKVCDRYAENGLISAAEYKRYQELSVGYRSMIAPDGKTTLDQYIDIKPHELKVPENINITEIATVFDKSMLKSSLLVFDEYYIKNILQRDVAAMVMNIQKAGIAVTDYQVNRVENLLGNYDEYTVRVNPIEGSSSTIRFKLPVIDDDGVFTANGSRYVLRKQRGDMPLRKISPSKVALTSYYGKTFVEKARRKVNDYGTWIRNAISAIDIDPTDQSITQLYHSSEFDNTFMCPRIYSTLAMEFKSFTLTPKSYPRSVGMRHYEVNLNHRKRKELYGEEIIKKFEIDGSIVAGVCPEGGHLVIDKNNVFYHALNERLIAIGDIEQMLNIDRSKAPVEYAELKVLGRNIPVGVVLGYELGIERLIKLLKVDVRRVPVGTRVNLMSFEYALVFNDETLVFSKDNQYASMILNGFNEYHKTLREFNVHEFDQRGVYLNLIESQGMTHRYLREIDSLYQLFIDPITRDLLIEMKEPVTFRGLLLRSCELLQHDQHPDELDSAYMRTKGYERLSGAVYTEITKAIRAHAGRPGKSKLPIDLNPYQIWTAITSDSAKVQISEINPIENLKQQEAMTYAGSGGRSSRSMVKHTRSYHPNDMGVVSEATVDSSDVAINTYTSANPAFTTVRGTARRFNKNKDGLTSLVSTSVLMAPYSTKDD